MKKKTTIQTMTAFSIQMLPLLLGTAVLCVLISLSFWQYQRAQEKKAQQIRLFEHQSRSILTENDLKAPTAATIHLRQGQLTGHFDNEFVYLLDNQTHQGHVGYHVLTPFYWQQIPTPQWVLVNRGWIAAPRERTQLPAVDKIIGSVTLKGTFRSPSNHPLIKDMAEPDVITWPRRIQKIDLSQISSELTGSGLPAVLYLPVDSLYSLTAVALPEQWLTPERHIGYAVQWGGLALAWFIILSILYRRHTSKSR